MFLAQIGSGRIQFSLDSVRFGFGSDSVRLRFATDSFRFGSDSVRIRFGSDSVRFGFGAGLVGQEPGQTGPSRAGQGWGRAGPGRAAIGPGWAGPRQGGPTQNCQTFAARPARPGFDRLADDSGPASPEPGGGMRRRTREEERGRRGGKKKRKEALQKIVRLSFPARPGQVLIDWQTIPAQPRLSQQEGRGRRAAQ